MRNADNLDVTDIHNMSDEEFLNLVPPSSSEEEDEVEVEQEEENSFEELEEESEDDVISDETVYNNDDDSVEPEDVDEESHDTEEDNTEENSDEAEAASGSHDSETETDDVDYEQFYKKVMSPFKANGKLITLKSPEEAISLMQKGSDYTQKTQQLAAHRRILTTLEEHNLLSEDKINFLIDLDKKNPNAIRKLVQDAEIDSWDLLDEDEEASEYQKGNYVVSDEYVDLRDTVQAVGQTAHGNEILNTIHSTWDDESKSEIIKNPEVLHTFAEQKESGVYDYITSEIDRLKSIGQLDPNIPFVYAYAQVGQQLVASSGHEQSTGTAAPIARGKGRVNAGPRANPQAGKAAPPKKALKGSRNKDFNPLGMSDEYFMKNQDAILASIRKN